MTISTLHHPNFYSSQSFKTSQIDQKFEDPSEPIYTDPSLFERSRSLRSLTVPNMSKVRSLDGLNDR